MLERVEKVVDIIVEEDFDERELNQLMDYCWNRLKRLNAIQRKNYVEIDKMFGIKP